MITNYKDLKLEELTHVELINTTGGVSIWRYVGVYIRLRLEGISDTSAMIGAGALAYSEN